MDWGNCHKAPILFSRPLTASNGQLSAQTTPIQASDELVQHRGPELQRSQGNKRRHRDASSSLECSSGLLASALMRGPGAHQGIGHRPRYGRYGGRCPRPVAHVGTLLARESVTPLPRTSGLHAAQMRAGPSGSEMQAGRRKQGRVARRPRCPRCQDRHPRGGRAFLAAFRLKEPSRPLSERGSCWVEAANSASLRDARCSYIAKAAGELPVAHRRPAVVEGAQSCVYSRVARGAALGRVTGRTARSATSMARVQSGEAGLAPCIWRNSSDRTRRPQPCCVSRRDSSTRRLRWPTWMHRLRAARVGGRLSREGISRCRLRTRCERCKAADRPDRRHKFRAPAATHRSVSRSQ